MGGGAIVASASCGGQDGGGGRGHGPPDGAGGEDLRHPRRDVDAFWAGHGAAGGGRMGP